jgi:hypothetical protein
MAAPLIRKKLYFDVNFGSGTGGIGQAVATTVPALYFPCTQFTNGVAGDRYGAVLQALEACTGNTPNQIKAQREVSAWFAFAGGGGQLTVTSAGSPVAVDFVQPTGTVANHANVTRLKVLNTAGTTQFAKGGFSAIYGTLGIERHFSVRVRKANASGVATTTSVRGTLYVARQHSIEV